MPPPDADTEPPNRLARESSAYLRQHMDNPVDWHPWGPEALERAAAEDKPLLVSIGYSACHWCHVMAHESFEDPETARRMNELFVNVKVDREERPDVDQIYMDTVVRLTGQGGWPLTVFCRPDGRPFHAGTYYPSPDSPHRRGGPSFPDVLQAVADAWRTRRDEIDRNCEEILAALAARPEGEAEGPPGARHLAAAAWALMEHADRRSGGFGQGPKFPTPTSLEALIAACDYLDPDDARDVFRHALHTAGVMARSGLYDHLGGGFHRYCVDGQWTIPHFEKMLYDNGLLMRFYAEMWRRTGGTPELEWPLRETAAWLRREMTGEAGAGGGFYASQDADSEGEEGRFFVWTPAQIDAVLGEEAGAELRTAYGVTQAGNFEGGTTHLVDRAGRPREHLRAERERLYAARAERVAPATDTKRIAAWNGYAISGLVRAGDLLRCEEMRADAVAAADFVWEHMRDDAGRLLRIHDGERAKVGAFLDDHAAMLDACLDLARAGAGERFLGRASELADAIGARFFDPDTDDLFLTPVDAEPLPHRPRSDHDGATPQAAGLAVLGLLRVGELSGRHELGNVATRVLDSHALLLDRAAHAFPTMARAAALAERGLGVAVVVGDADDPRRQALAVRARRELLPEDAVVVATPDGAPPGVAPHWTKDRPPVDGGAAVYLCRRRACSLPVTDPDRLALSELPPPEAGRGR